MLFPNLKMTQTTLKVSQDPKASSQKRTQL